jgi:hypothetical protein
LITYFYKSDTFVRKFAGKEYRMIENPYVPGDESSKEEKYRNLTFIHLTFKL